MELKMPHKREKGQVGIGTLIVFIAMVLVAAIAAGVLINTAGFLQSQSEQTGEESSAQVTNQLQVISTTGQVTQGASSADDTQLQLELEGASNTLTVVDDLTIGASDITDSGTTTNSLEVSGGSGSITFDANQDITFNVLNESAYEVQHNGDTLTVDTDAGEELTTDAGTVDIADNYEGTSGIVTFGAGGSTLSLNSLNTVTAQLTIDSGTSSIEVLDGGSVSVDTDESTLTVGDGTNTFDVDADGETFELDVSVSGEDEILDITDDNTFTVTGPDGNSIEVDSSDTLEFNTGTETVVLSSGGEDVSGSSFATDGTALALGYVDAGDAGTDPKIDRIEVIVTRSPGASDIDMSQTTINFIAPDGSHDLTYSDGDTPEEDSTFTLSAVQDEDDTLPVLSSGDRFTINIDPGTLDAGTTSELRVTTPSGATKSLLVRVPDSLANQEAVGL